MSSPTIATLPRAFRTPLLRALLLSVALHLAVLGVLQVAPVGYEASVTVLQVHLPEPDTMQAEVEREAQQLPVAAAEPLPTIQTAPMPSPAPVPAAEAASPTAAEPAQAAAKIEPGLLSLPSPVDLRWYGPREVDVHPKQLGTFDTEPYYPKAAKRQGLEGWVKVRITIDEYGVVKQAEAIEGSPPGVFDAAAVEASLRVKFEPARRGGRPVRYEGNFRVTFELR